MQTHFLSLELECYPAPDLQRQILEALRRSGDPLRWAIVAIDPVRGKVKVEAVVTSEDLLSSVPTTLV